MLQRIFVKLNFNYYQPEGKIELPQSEYSKTKKQIIFYSHDFNIGYSFLMYLQNVYQVTITTDINVLKNIIYSVDVDLLIFDAEPTEKMEQFFEELKLKKPKIPVILTYVYKAQIKELDSRLRKSVDSVFYKPYDLNEVTRKLTALMV
jgi:DNA-binding response OmpR family regulator